MMRSSAAKVITKLTAGSSYATNELLKRERIVGQVYEVVQSDIGIVSALNKNGISSFHTSMDFYEYDCAFHNVITEPGPTISEKFVSRALYVTYHKVALFLPLRFMETPEAKKLFDSTPLVRVYVLTKRFPYRRGCMAWFVWEKGNYDKPSIRWI